MKRDFIYNGIHVGEHGFDPFIGELMGEPGSMYACKAPGYYLEGDTTEWRRDQRNYRLRFDHENLDQAHQEYIRTLSHFVDINWRNGMPHVMTVDATAFAKYFCKRCCKSESFSVLGNLFCSRMVRRKAAMNVYMVMAVIMIVITMSAGAIVRSWKR